MGSVQVSLQSHTHIHTPTYTMVVPDCVKDKVGQMPDVSSMSKEDLAALVKQLYDQSCAVFGEKFHMEYAVKKGHGNTQPRDGDQRVTRYIQNTKTKESEQVQNDGR